MKYIWAIASYKRVDRQPWLEQLVAWGYQREEILLSTQSKGDYEAYRKKWGRVATVVYEEGHNVSDNKNTALEYASRTGAQIIMCADKLRGILKLSPDGKSLQEVKTREGMEEVLDYMIKMRDRLGGEIAGTYPVGNAFYMSHSIHVNQQMLGCFMLFKPNTEWRFNPDFPLKEDFEVIMRIISRGGRVVRFNFLALKETLHTEGGCHEWWNSEGDSSNAQVTETLLRTYPKLVRKHPTRENEIKYIGPSKRIDYKKK